MDRKVVRTEIDDCIYDLWEKVSCRLWGHAKTKKEICIIQARLKSVRDYLDKLPEGD